MRCLREQVQTLGGLMSLLGRPSKECCLCGEMTYDQAAPSLADTTDPELGDEKSEGKPGWKCKTSSRRNEEGCGMVVCEECISDGEKVSEKDNYCKRIYRDDFEPGSIDRDKPQAFGFSSNVKIRVEKRGNSSIPGYKNRYVYWYCPYCGTEHNSPSWTKRA